MRSPGDKRIERHASQPLLPSQRFQDFRTPDARTARAPSQVQALRERQRSKLVYLPESQSKDDLSCAGEAPASPSCADTEAHPPHPHATERVFAHSSSVDGLPDENRGRVTVFCLAERIDRNSLLSQLLQLYSRDHINTYPEAIHLHRAYKSSCDIFFFEYGVLVCWGLTPLQEDEMLKKVVAFNLQNPIRNVDELEVDHLQYHFSDTETPNISNNIITIRKKQAQDRQVQLALSHALAQSIKLNVAESRVMALVETTKHLAPALAHTGKIKIDKTTVARLIGKLYLERCRVTLLNPLMGTPTFFWDKPDNLQVLYKSIREYLELEDRVAILNIRFQVLQEMLDVLRDVLNRRHMVNLEWIVIWLIVISVVVGLLEVGSLFGFFPNAHHP